MIWDYEKILLRRLLLWDLLSAAAGVVLWLSGSPFGPGAAIVVALVSGLQAVAALRLLRGLDVKFDQHVDLDLARKESSRLRRVLWDFAALGALLAAAGVVLIGARQVSQDHFWLGAGWGLAAEGIFLFILMAAHALGIPKDVFLPDLHLFEDPRHATFILKGGAPAALLLHGFPDTPVVMRPLAEALNAQGWTVEAQLLPGYGPEIPDLFQYRAAEWIAAIEQEFTRLKANHNPVLLVGFSMGAGLSVSAARNARPDGLVLLAPFWLRETRVIRLAVEALRLVLPPSLRLLRWFSYLTPDVRREAHVLTPGVDMDDPITRQILGELRIPLDFLEQFRRMGRYTQYAAPALDMPVLVMRGRGDRVVNSTATRHLVELLRGPVTYIEVNGGHTITLQEHEDFARVKQTVLEFAQTFLEKHA